MKHLVILATSDLHGNLEDGMARLYSCVRLARQQADNVLLLDAGDCLQGSPMLDRLCPTRPDAPHPVMEAMNRMGFDAWTPGNHDFDFGVPYLQSVLRQADFPVLAGNVRTPDGVLLTGRGYTIVTRAGVRIAILGVTTPYLRTISTGGESVAALRCRPAWEAVRDMIAEIGDRADLFLVSAHLGACGEFDPEGGSDSAWRIAEENPQVCVLQMAHTHILETGRRGGAVYGEVRDRGREVLRFELTLDDENRLTDSSVTAVPLERFPPSPEIRDMALLRECSRLAQALAVQEPESPVIGAAAAPFRPEDVSLVRVQETAMPQLINRVQLLCSGADVSACSLPDPACGFAAGPVTQRMLERVYPFPNYLVRVRITGRELVRYLEWNARCFTVTKTGVTPDPDYPVDQQDYFSGVRYEIHADCPAGSRIRNVQFRGQPLQPDTVLHLAVSNYRLNTHLRREGILNGETEWQSQETVRELMQAYITAHSPLVPQTENGWKLVTGGEEHG